MYIQTCIITVKKKLRAINKYKYNFAWYYIWYYISKYFLLVVSWAVIFPWTAMKDESKIILPCFCTFLFVNRIEYTERLLSLICVEAMSRIQFCTAFWHDIDVATKAQEIPACDHVHIVSPESNVRGRYTLEAKTVGVADGCRTELWKSDTGDGSYCFSEVYLWCLCGCRM